MADPSNYSNNNNNTDHFMSECRDNTQVFLDSLCHNEDEKLKKNQMKILVTACINDGHEFIVKTFHYLMNFMQRPSINVLNYKNPKQNNDLIALINSLRIESQYDIYDCVGETVDLDMPKKLDYWANLMMLIESKSIQIKTSSLIQHLYKTVDSNNEYIIRIYYVLKIFLKAFDHHDEMYNRQQYRLCVTLINIYFDLIELMNNDNDDDDDKCDENVTIIMDCLVTCQTFLTNISKSSSLNECIILRGTLELIRQKSHLFSDFYSNIPTSNNSINDGHQWPSLLNENMSSNHDWKMKKNALLPFYSTKKKQKCLNEDSALNRKLLMDLIESCLNNPKVFADNFINSLSDQSLLPDAPILDEDPRDGQVQHVRMTFETDLHIYRLFNSNPILWDILQLISQKKSLANCLAVIRCILNVLRTNLISSTSHENHLSDAQRFLWILANDEILPRIPFIYIPETFTEQIKPYEVAMILHDVARYIRDNQDLRSSETSLRPYLNRLRVILAHKKPNSTYLKIFLSL